MGYDVDAAIAKAKKLKESSFGKAVSKIGGQAAGKATAKVRKDVATRAVTQRYGSPTPTVQQVQSQAEAIAQWDTDMDVTTFLNQAVTDGVVTPSEAESIFGKTTGGSLFSQQNQQKMVSEATRLMNGGTPVWMTQQVNRDFGNYTAEQAKYLDMSYEDYHKLYHEKLGEYYRTFDSSMLPELQYLEGKVSEAMPREQLARLSGYNANKVEEVKKDIEISPESMAIINMYPKAFDIERKNGVYSYSIKDEGFLLGRGYSSAEIKKLKTELGVIDNKVKKMDKAVEKAEEYAAKAVKSNFIELGTMNSVANPESANFDKNFESYAYTGKAIPFEKVGEAKTTTIKERGVVDTYVKEIDNKRALAMVLAERNGKAVPNVPGLKLDSYRMATDKELELFAYYLGRDLETGGNEAGRYADLLEDEMALRWGKKDSEERKGFFPNLGLAANTGLEQYVQGIERNFDKKDYYPITPLQASTMYTTEGLRKEGRNIAATAMDLGVTAFNMAPSILLSTVISMVLSPAVGKLASAGTKGVQFAGKALSYAPRIAGNLSMGLSARGNAYAQMINQGYSAEQATAYGNMIMASEVGLQTVLGGISKLGGISTKVTKAISQVDNALVRLAIQYPVAFTGESAEEGLQAYLEPIFKEIALGYDTGEEIDWGQIVYEAFLGGLMGGIFESPEIITSNGKVYIQDRATGRKININDNISALINEAKKDAGSENYKRATKLENGKKVSDAKVGALLRHMVEDGQISEADAKTLVTEGLDGAPLDKAEQVYFYAGANGLSIQDTVELNSDLDVDSDRAIKAWQMGAKLYEGRKADVQNAEAVEKHTEKPKEIEKTKEAPAVQNGGNVAETPAVQNNGKAKSIVRENYNEAAEEFRTEENAELFDVAYNQGLLGEKLNLGVIVPDKDISAVSQAYVAGTRDARIIAEKRANFDNRTPGLFTDAVTEQLSKKIGSRTLNAIDALGKKLGVQIRFIQRGEPGHEKDSYYSPSDGVIAINVNEIHGKLTGDKLLRFIANHEGIHRIKETSPKAYAEMEKLALSKSKQTVEDRMARFGESKERATEEIVADYFGEVLTSKAEIKTLLNKHRSVFDAIMEALEWLVDKMRGIANYSFSEIAEARKLFQEALAEADATVWGAEVRSDGDTLWAKSEKDLTSEKKSGYNNREQYKVMWTLEEGLLDKSEIARIYEAVGEIKRGIEFPETPTGESIIDLYDKLAFVGGTYNYPEVSKVILFDIKDSYLKAEAMMEVELFEQGGSESGEYTQIIDALYGEETVKVRNFYDSETYKKAKWNSKGRNGEANIGEDKSGGLTLYSYSDNEDSEDNVKYFPPGEDPRRDIKVPSEVNGKKVMRFTRTAAESPALTPEMAEDVVSEIENGRFYYTPSSNKALADNAMNKVENDVIKAASEWKTAFDSGKRFTDNDIALGEALIIEAGKRGDTERAIELICEVGIAVKEAGKVVQAVKLLKRMTPEGQVYYLSKVVERLNKERGKTKGKEFNKSIEAENKATEADKKYKQAEAKVKTAEEKLFDIETAIEEYTKDLDIEVKIAESVEKIADLKKKLSEAKGKVKSADASTEKLGGKIKEIEGQLEEERKKLKEAMAKRDANLKERAEKGIMLSKLKAGVKRVDNATDHILSQIDILEDDISKVEAEYDKAVELKNKYSEKRKELTAERNSLIKKTESADKASEKDRQKISQLEEEIILLSDNLASAQRMEKVASEKRKELANKRNGLKSKLSRIENAIVWENENRETEIAKLKEEIAQLLNAEYEASKELEKAKEERTLKQKARDKARKLSSAAKMGANIIELPADIKKAILESKTEEELNESVELAKDYIAENMVTTKAEMIKAWRYLSMLGNLRTQVRNIIGNGFMLLNVMSKNAVATPIETIAVYASHKNLEKKLAKMKADGATEEEITAYRDEHYAERTKSWTLFKKKSDALKSFVTESWESNIKLAKGQSGKNDNIIGDINDRRTIFKSEKPVLKQVAAGVEVWRKATNWAMERGDEVFLKINYKHALTSYILSNKWDVATMTEAQKMRAEQYALKEAQEATFRDESVLADLINKARNKGWGYELAIGGLMPFTKTPINITKRSIEYGPTGIVNAIAQGVKAAKGEARSSDVVNALAKTFSGSALAGLGFYLAAKGLLRSKGDEEDEEYNYLIGEQDYSLIIGDYRFSIEWAAPAAVPLLFGASIYNAWFDKDGGIKEEYMVDENGNIVLNTNSMATHKVMNAVSTMFAPIFEASYLSGLTDSVGAAFSFGSGDASEGLAIFGINAGLSYANQFIPTVFGQLARTIDPVERRNNDYDKTSILPYSVQRGIEKSKNKIPFLNRTSTPYVNAWGEEEIKQEALDYILSVAENFVLPGYIEKVTDDELTDELWRLKKTKAAEGKKVFPESVKTSYTEAGETIPLTAEQRNKRQKVAGQKGRKYIEAFYNSDEYGKLTDAERVEAIDLLWGKANEEGIQAVRPDYVSKDSNVIKMNITEKNVGINPVDYTLWKIAYEKADEDENGSYNTDEVNAALDIFIELSGEEWTDEQLGYLWETRASALSKSNPYGRALLGTPWYQRKKEEGNTWMRERE